MLPLLLLYIYPPCCLCLIILAIAGWMYKKKRTSLDRNELTDVTDGLQYRNDNLGARTSPYIFINKAACVTSSESPKAARTRNSGVLKAFGLCAPDSNVLDEIINSSSYESRFKNADGTITSIAWSTSLVRKGKKCSIYVSTGFNLTELKKMKTNLASANDFFNSSMELAEIGMLMTTDRQLFRASPELLKTLGLKSNSISLRDLHMLIHPNDRMQFDTAVKSEDYENVKCIDIRFKSADGTFRWYSYRYKSIAGTENTLPLFGGAILDVTQEHEKDILIERLAYIDEITEIANRNKLVGVGKEIYETCRMLNYSHWIIVLDIDRFHIINDTCGYTNGNNVLRDFAHILYKFVTPGSLAAGSAATISRSFSATTATANCRQERSSRFRTNSTSSR